MKKKEDLRIVKTKKNLYEGLLKLMKDKSFENIKVSEICAVALVNRSTFYDHFTDKYELLEGMIRDLQLEFEDELSQYESEESDRTFYLKLIGLLYDHIFNNYEIYSNVLKNNFSSVAKDMLKNKAIIDVTNRIQKLNLNKKATAEFIARFYVSAIIEVGIMVVESPNKMTKDEFFDCLYELIPESIFQKLIKN